MKSVRVNHDTKMIIKEYDDGTYDENLNKLMDTVMDYMPIINELDDSSLIINLKEDTVDRLSSFKLTNTEPLGNVIVRMFITSQLLNSSND